MRKGQTEAKMDSDLISSFHRHKLWRLLLVLLLGRISDLYKFLSKKVKARWNVCVCWKREILNPVSVACIGSCRWFFGGDDTPFALRPSHRIKAVTVEEENINDVKQKPFLVRSCFEGGKLLRRPMTYCMTFCMTMGILGRF